MAPLDRIGGPDRINSGQSVMNNRRVDAGQSKDTPAFSLLQDGDGGVIYEPSAPKEREKTLAQKQAENRKEVKPDTDVHSKFDGPGVKVELSTQGVTRLEETKAPGLLDSIKSVFLRIRDAISKFWNETGEAEAEVQEAISNQEIPTQGLEAESLAEIPGDVVDGIPEEQVVYATDEAAPTVQELKNDPESIAKFMVDYGGRHLAKNSTLLTQYDRNGNITAPSPSDSRRILQGDRGVTQL